MPLGTEASSSTPGYTHIHARVHSQDGMSNPGTQGPAKPRAGEGGHWAGCVPQEGTGHSWFRFAVPWIALAGWDGEEGWVGLAGRQPYLDSSREVCRAHVTYHVSTHVQVLQLATVQTADQLGENGCGEPGDA